MKSAFALFALLTLGACSLFPKPLPIIQQQVIVIGPSQEAVDTCRGFVSREDVPYHTDRRTSNLESNAYTRKLEDGYEYCRNALVSTANDAAAARVRANQH